MLRRHPKLKVMRIVLASASPRRKEILTVNGGLSIEVIPSNFEEDIDKRLCSSPEEYVSRTSLGKLNDILERIEKKDIVDSFDIVICADTIVVRDNEILEKPSSPSDALRMLQSLSGRSHRVLTAVTLGVKLSSSGQFNTKSFVETTQVHFAELDDESIEAYIATGEPFDKAGGYGIQALGSSFVKGIEGCYFNVVGFPLHRFCVELLAMLP